VRLPAGGVGHVSLRVCLFARCWRRPMYEVVLLFVKTVTAVAAALFRLLCCLCLGRWVGRWVGRWQCSV
jgi:hypothetical protein